MVTGSIFPDEPGRQRPDPLLASTPTRRARARLVGVADGDRLWFDIRLQGERRLHSCHLRQRPARWLLGPAVRGGRGDDRELTDRCRPPGPAGRERALAVPPAGRDRARDRRRGDRAACQAVRFVPAELGRRAEAAGHRVVPLVADLTGWSSGRLGRRWPAGSITARQPGHHGTRPPPGLLTGPRCRSWTTSRAPPRPPPGWPGPTGTRSWPRTWCQSLRSPSGSRRPDAGPPSKRRVRAERVRRDRRAPARRGRRHPGRPRPPRDRGGHRLRGELGLAERCWPGYQPDPGG